MHTLRSFPRPLPVVERGPLVDALFEIEEWMTRRYRLSVSQRLGMFGRHARNADGVFKEFPWL